MMYFVMLSSFTRYFYLTLISRGIRATSKGLSVVDSIVPTLLVHLEQRTSKFTLEGLQKKKVTKHHRARLLKT